MKTPKITISGVRGSGKTVLGLIIEKALIDAGVKFKSDVGEGDSPEVQNRLSELIGSGRIEEILGDHEVELREVATRETVVQPAERRVVIMRGLPGAGKSTWIQKNIPNAFVCSADHYFMKTGEYKFDPTKLHAAHTQCQSKFLEAMVQGQPLIAIDNCNLSARDMRFYVNHAPNYGYTVEIVNLHVPAEVAKARGLHNVPADRYPQLAANFKQLLPKEWDSYVKDVFQ